MTARYS